MKWARRASIYLAALLALAPAGIRALTWSQPSPLELDDSAIAAGKMLFTHDWTPNDSLSPNGDGLGPVFNATSCVACHSQGGLGGSGGLEHNVTMFTIQPTRPGEMMRSGVVHAMAIDFQESLAQVHRDLPNIAQPVLRRFTTRSGARGAGFDFALPAGIGVSQRNTPALFGARAIDEIADRDIIAQERKQRLRWGLLPTGGEIKPVGRALRLADGRIGRFGWKAQSPTLLAFVQAACANELGLGNPGQPQPRPLSKPDYEPAGLDLTAEQCLHMTAFIASLPRPVERFPEEPAARNQADAGRSLFTTIGCADCHTPNIGSVEGIYSDLLLHRMGPDLEGGGFYYGDIVVRTSPTAPPASPVQGPLADEWRTPPLWGVADSGPYLHDGRAATLEEAIQLHAGQGAAAARAFTALPASDQANLIAFLKTLKAP